MPSVAYVMVAVALLSTAGVGTVLYASNEAPERVDIEGRIIHVAWNPHWDVAVEYEVQVAASNGETYLVELGPPWWWTEVGLPAIERNDTLRVEGVLHEGNVVEAYTIWVNGGDSLLIRDGGKPAWAGEAPGRRSMDDVSP